MMVLLGAHPAGRPRRANERQVVRFRVGDYLPASDGDLITEGAARPTSDRADPRAEPFLSE